VFIVCGDTRDRKGRMTGIGHELGQSLKDVMSLESARHSAGTSSATRAMVFDGVRSSSEAVTCEDLATSLDLHVNTVRGHLDALVDSGYVVRSAAVPDGPGRPRMTYVTSPGLVTRLDELASQLGDALATADADQVARLAADSWRDRPRHAAPANGPDEAVDRAVSALRGVGFQASADDFGESITMSSCPYTALIEDYPVICAIHAQLVSGVLEDAGQPVSLEGVDVWLKPGMCRARLTRADRVPQFTVPVHALRASRNGPQAREIP